MDHVQKTFQTFRKLLRQPYPPFPILQMFPEILCFLFTIPNPSTIQQMVTEALVASNLNLCPGTHILFSQANKIITMQQNAKFKGTTHL
jgi:hypothetical protein